MFLKSFIAIVFLLIPRKPQCGSFRHSDIPQIQYSIFWKHRRLPFWGIFFSAKIIFLTIIPLWKKVWNFDPQLLLAKKNPTTLKVCGIDAARWDLAIPQKKTKKVKNYFFLIFQILKSKFRIFRPSRPPVTPCLNHSWDYNHTKASTELSVFEDIFTVGKLRFRAFQRCKYRQKRIYIKKVMRKFNL